MREREASQPSEEGGVCSPPQDPHQAQGLGGGESAPLIRVCYF